MVEGLLNPNRWIAALNNLDIFWDGLFMTLKVALVGLMVALVLGFLFGFMSTSKSKFCRGITRVYVEFFQNTPLVIQVFFYFNGLPFILKELLNTPTPVRVSKFWIGVIGVGLYHGAYISEVVRTGIQSVPKGQKEAAHSQGFSTLHTMRYVVLPQALKVIMPPLTNQALNLVKNTSVLAMVAGLDLMYFADNYVSQSGYLQGYILCAAMYFLLCFPLARLAKWLEEKSKRVPTRGDTKRKEVVKEVS